MKAPIVFCLAAVGAFLVGCSTTATQRIAHNRPAYDSWSPHVQATVAAGHIEPGFTEEQVRIAFGEPSRRMVHTGTDGSSELWFYGTQRSRVGFGLGLSAFSYGGRSAVGTSIGVSDTTAFRGDEGMRVTFRDGVVTSIDNSRR